MTPKIPHPWRPDCGDGSYRNPVLCADYSDPDVVRHGDDFYLTASSFNCTPALPILHSRDLVNWTIINHAVKNLPHARYEAVQPGCGVWAPAIRRQAGKFWIFFPTPDEGIYVVTAEDPAGAWSEPHLLLAGKGIIDPCPLWDDDGRAYLIHAYAGSRAGTKNKLHVREMAQDASLIVDDGRVVFEDAARHPTIEGPKFHKWRGWYYISAPSGGVTKGSQAILRSRSVYGPYEDRIVLSQRGTPTNGPHQGALVDTADGEWWFVHFQDADLYGRIVHVQPVRWEDDWPLIGVDQDAKGVGRPVQRHRKPVASASAGALQTSDDFAGPDLGRQWQWHSNHRDSWHSLSERPGHLRLHSQFVTRSDFSKAGNLLLQKFPAREFAVETELDLPRGQDHVHAGLIVMSQEPLPLDVRRINGQYVVELTVGGEAIAREVCETPTLTLRVEVGEGGVCRFGIRATDGEIYLLGPAFPARKGVWIGAKVGLYCLRSDILAPATGHADFAHFQVLPPAPAA